MSRKLVITKLENHIVSALYEDSHMIQVNADPIEETSLLGNIYVGKVKNIVKNINAAFVEIAERQMCYLSLREAHHPVFTSQESREIRMGDEILIQISKEDVKTKAPVGTTDFSLTGKYSVLVHGRPMISVSQKIEDESEKKRLKQLAKEFAGSTYGWILRTNACEAPEEVIKEELKSLVARYEEILSYGIYRNRFSLIYKTPRAYLCTMRDSFAKDVSAIVTDDPELFEQMKEYLTLHQKEDLPKLTFYEDKMLPLVKLYSVEHNLSQALREKVWLDCGGTLIIQPTEALTVIDVNTGKAVSKKKDVQETFFKVNLQAAREIAKQVRLRNLSGIIIIDFIDMEEEEKKNELMAKLRFYFKSDPVKTTVIDMTALNLVEITRKKVRKPLAEQTKNMLLKS